MVCDGHLAQEEIKLIQEITSKQEIFNDIGDVEAIVNEYITSINEQGNLFLKQYLNELEELELSVEEQLSVIDFSLQAILADREIKYPEVKFFKKIVHHMYLTEEQILSAYPDIEDFLLPDNVSDDIDWNSVVFDTIDFNTLG